MNYTQYISTKYTLCYTLDELSHQICADDYCRSDKYLVITHLKKKIEKLKDKIKDYEDEQILSNLY